MLQQLFINSIEYHITEDNKKISVNPTFICPVCQGNPTNVLNVEYTININKPIDFAGIVSFDLPCHPETIELYLAVHKSQGVNDLVIRVVRTDEGPVVLPENWWVPQE